MRSVTAAQSRVAGPRASFRETRGLATRDGHFADICEEGANRKQTPRAIPPFFLITGL